MAGIQARRPPLFLVKDGEIIPRRTFPFFKSAIAIINFRLGAEYILNVTMIMVTHLVHTNIHLKNIKKTSRKLLVKMLPLH